MKKIFKLIFTFIFLFGCITIISAEEEKKAYWTLGGEDGPGEYFDNSILFSVVYPLSGCTEQQVFDSKRGTGKNCDLWYYLDEIIFVNKNESGNENYVTNMCNEYDCHLNMDISQNHDGSVMAYLINDNLTLVIVTDGKLYFSPDSSRIFSLNYNLRSIEGLGVINTSNVVDMSRMFDGLGNVEELDLSNFDTTNVTDMSYLFHSLKVTQLDLSSFNTSKVTDMSGMFGYCKYLKKLDLSHFDTSKVTDMSSMFDNTTALKKLDLRSFNTLKVEDMSWMFDSAGVEKLYINSFDTSKVEDMSYMFYNLDKLEYLDLRSFNTSNVVDMSSMFESMNKLRKIYVGNNFKLNEDLESEDMFTNSTLLYGENGTTYDANHVDAEYARIDSRNKPGYFSSKVPVDNVDVELEDKYAYDGNPVEIKPDIYFNGILLRQNIDYSLTYRNINSTGVGTIVITGLGKYTGEKEMEFDIISSITLAQVDEIEDQSYTGSAITPDVVLRIGNKVLVKDLDYELEYENNVNMGTATIKITGINDYTGEMTKTFEIKGINIANYIVPLIAPVVYNGEAHEPNVFLTDLVKDTDYTIRYENNLNAGTASVFVTGIGLYDGNVEVNFQILPVSILDFEFGTVEDMNYTGSELKPKVTVSKDETVYVENTDYTLSYENNINAGTATVIVTGTGNYADEKRINFNILQLDINDFVLNEIEDVEYTGKEIIPNLFNKELTKDVDYEIEISNNKNVGTVNATITGKGNYKGTKNITFNIVKLNITKVLVDSITEQKYTGEQIIPNVFKNDVTLADSDYEITVENNINVGQATLTVTGIGNCQGSKEYTFVISRDLKFATIDPINNQEYTGKPIIPNIVVKFNNNVLVKDTDYELIFEDNTNEGTATVTINGIGDYTGTITTTFDIIPVPYENQIKYIGQKSVSDTSVTLKWNKVNSAKGYYVQVKNGKKWKTVATVKKATTLNATIKKLSAGTKYTYKVQAYKVVNKKNKVINTTNEITILTKPGKAKISVKSSSYNSITITYKKVKSATKYEIYRSTSKTGTYEKVGETTGLTYVDKNLVTGKTYFYKVRVCNKNCGGYSNIVSKKTALKAPSITLKSSYEKQATITSTIVPGEDGYVIEYSTNAKKGFKSVKTIESTNTKYTHENSALKAKKVFYYRVKAYRLVNGKKVFGPYSKVQKVTISTKKLIKLKSISLNIDKIALDESKKITITYNPTNKVENIVLWETSDENIISIDQEGNIHANALGTATITATTTNGIVGTKNIVVYKKADTFELNKKTIELYKNDTDTLTATITPDDATYKTVNYKSSNTKIAKVDNNGLVTAIGYGTTKIIASTEEGITRECTVTVVERPLIFTGHGNATITDIEVPEGEYIAIINITTTQYDVGSVDFYYDDDTFASLMIAGGNFSGSALLKEGNTNEVTDGVLVVETEGDWTIKFEKLTNKATFPISGSGQMVTGWFEGTGKNDVYHVSMEDEYGTIYIYEYNGGEDDFDYFAETSGDPLENETVVFKTVKGKKYFFVIDSDQNYEWSIRK